MKMSFALLLLFASLLCLFSCNGEDGVLEKKEKYGFAPNYLLRSISLSQEELDTEVQSQLKYVGFSENDFFYLEGEDSVAVSEKLQVVVERLEQALSGLPEDVYGYLDIYGCKVSNANTIWIGTVWADKHC